MATYDNVISRNHMLVKPNVKWFQTELSFNATPAKVTDESQKISADRIQFLEIRAAKLLARDVELFQRFLDKSANRSNAQWIRTVLKSGTLSDVMAAHTLLLQDSAVHNRGSLSHLIKCVDPKGNRECIMAAETLKDIFLGNLLPPNRKLSTFENNPLREVLDLVGSDAADRALIVWHFESLLKQAYIEFVLALSKMAHHPLDTTKQKGIRIMINLLTSHPEQEQLLLRNLVNKLGDPNQKVAAFASQCLCQLVDKHPLMKGVLTAELESLLFRTNITNKARYYGVCFLNQLILSKDDDAKLGAKLIVIYLALFKACTKLGEVDSRMMSGLLTGVNRAFPYAELDSDVIAEQTDEIYRMIHQVTFNISVQALTLLFHILNSRDQFNDRFYGALYRKIIDPALKNSSKRATFLNLLFKTMKRDTVESRIFAFVKRLLQVAAEQNPALTCGLLLIISEVLKGGRLRRLLSCREINFNEEYAEDDDGDRIDGGAKEDGAFKTTPLKEIADKSQTQPASGKPATNQKETFKGSWVHREFMPSAVVRMKSSAPRLNYDPLHRNPTYARATSTGVWELLKLARHYHPSVALFANTLIEGNCIDYSGDPLQDFTLMRFLDRFVFRNPKQQDASKTLIQDNVHGCRRFYVPVGARALNVNSRNYINRGQKGIPVDEQFFFQYFEGRSKDAIDSVGGRPRSDDEEDIESVGSDEFDELLANIDPDTMSGEFDLDFANELLNQTSAKKKKKKRGAGSDGVDDDDDDDDEEVEFDDDFGDEFDDYSEDIRAAKEGASEESEESEFEADSSDEEIDERSTKKMGRQRTTDFLEDEDDFGDEELVGPPRKKSKSRRDKHDTSDLFASAEEFATMLEENERSEVDTITTEALSNKDNAHAKQLKWEQERNRWVESQNWKRRKGTARQSTGGRKKGPAGSVRPPGRAGPRRNVPNKTFKPKAKGKKG